jgi:phosphoglycerol transferase
LALSDEAFYELHTKYLYDSRFVPFMSNILYFFLYHPTSWLGANHVVGAKFLNALFLGLSLFPVSACARQFLSQRGAYLFSVFVILSPISSYSVYLMPESLYFLLFWVLTYLVVVRMPHRLDGAVYAGFVMAALSAVKPHAFALIVTIPIVLLGLYWVKWEEIPTKNLVRANLGYLAALVIGRLILNYLIAGSLIVWPFGRYYAQFLTPSMRPKRPLLSMNLWYSLGGHFSYLMLLFWPAIVLSLWPSGPAKDKGRGSTSYVALFCFSFATLLVLILLAAKYTADVTGVVDLAYRCRLPGRYYDFALGTLVLLFLARTRATDFSSRRSRRFSFAVIGGAIVAGVAAYFASIAYCPTILDFPEVVLIAKFHVALILAMVGSMGSAVALAFCARSTARFVYLAFLGSLALVTSSAVFVGQVLAARATAPEDLAAIAVRSLVADQVDDGVVIARTEDQRIYRAIFELYSLSEREVLPKTELTRSDLPPGTKWALLLDPYTLKLPYSAIVQGAGFEFVEFAPIGLSAAGSRPATAVPK